MAAIEVTSLWKSFGAVQAVRDLSFSVEPGRVTGFLGPNGAGKSTTLRMVLGLIRPLRGDATIDGRHYDHLDDPTGRVGAMLEDTSFHPGRSGENHLRVLAAAGGHPSSRVDKLIDLVSLRGAEKRRVGQYSQGMRQRLALASAMIGDPGVLILDEPTNGLDPKGMADMRAIIRRVGRGERTVLLSSHLLGEVQQVCDRVGVIQRGRLVIEGTVEELRGGSGILVRVEPLEKAREIAADLDGVEGAQIRDGMLMVDADPGRAAEVNAGLVSAGLRVSELRPVERSLEDVFLELTGGETV
jgi:ABC-type multidrug transport system ATPase subunit